MGESVDDREERIAEIRSRSAGADPEDPYEGVDLADLPAWWRRAIHEFDAHDLRPYRPPRFLDGELTHRVIEDLEREFDVDIRLASVTSDYRREWEVWVDDTVVETIGRHRSPCGYTVFELESDRFERRLRTILTRSGEDPPEER